MAHTDEEDYNCDPAALPDFVWEDRLRTQAVRESKYLGGVTPETEEALARMKDTPETESR